MRRKRPKYRARIPAAWFKLKPGMSTHFWITVYDTIRKKGIRKRDYKQVKEIADGLSS